MGDIWKVGDSRLYNSFSHIILRTSERTGMFAATSTVDIEVVDNICEIFEDIWMKNITQYTDLVNCSLI